MNEKIKVSIVVPIYNVENYIEDCVECLLKQTFKDIEIILVDDGSTDNGGKICDAFLSKDSRISVFHKENGGPASARNKGLENAHGEYISFVDTDDLVSQNFISALYEEAKTHNADIAVSRVRTIPEEDENYVNYWSFYVKKKLLIEPMDKIGVIYSCAAWNKLYRMDFLRKNNISFFENLFLEDVTFNQTCMILANKIVLVKEAEYMYNCQNAGSFMQHAHNNKRVLQMLDMTEYTKKIVLGNVHSDYEKILNTFEIKNIFGWFLKANTAFKPEFYKKMKQISLSMKTPMLFEEERKIKRLIDRSKNYLECLPEYKIIKLFKIIKLKIYNDRIYLLGFRIGKIKSVSNNLLGRF